MRRHPFWNAFYLLVALLVLALGGLACNASSGSLPTASPFPTQAPRTIPVIASPTVLPSLTPLPTITRLPPTPTASPSPTRKPTVTRSPSSSPIKLPAPLYFIDADKKQIFRLETDGKTVTQVTSEAKPVTSFDVSPKDGALVYVCDNNLVVTDAFGRDRKVLISDSLAMEKPNDSIYWTKSISAPHWSPDGTQIVYGKGGINVIDSSGGKPQLIQPNDLVDFSDVWKYKGAKRYIPVSWSPDGTRLLFQVSSIPDGADHVIKDLRDGHFVELQGPSSLENPVWNAAGTQMYRPDTVTIVGGGGGCTLRMFEAGTGEERELITSADDPNRGGPEAPASTCAIFVAPYPASNGQLYMFMTFASLEELFGSYPSVSYGMYRAAADGSKRVMLRQDVDNVLHALWAPDADGAVVISGKESWISRDNTEMLRVPTDSSKPITLLPVNGGTLRWGK